MKWSEITERDGKKEVSRQTERASFPLLFTEGYDYQAQAIFLSVSGSFPLSPSLSDLFPPSQRMTWLAQPRPRLNCAISYMFTLLASF